MVSNRSAMFGCGDSRVQLAYDAPKNGKADEQCRKCSPAHMVCNSAHSIPKDIKKIQRSLGSMSPSLWGSCRTCNQQRTLLWCSQ
jgi:hypothetical protein